MLEQEIESLGCTILKYCNKLISATSLFAQCTLHVMRKQEKERDRDAETKQIRKKTYKCINIHVSG